MTMTESLQLTDEDATLIIGETPLVPKEYIIAGYDMEGEVFLVSIRLNDLEIGFLLDNMYKVLSDRLK